MAVYRSSAVNSTASTSLTITTPAGAASGDVLIAYLLTDENGNTITGTGGGWTAGPGYNAQDITFSTFYRTLSGAPAANYNFTSTADMIGGIICIDSEGGTSPVVAVNGAADAADDNIATPVIANVADPRVLVALFACDSAFTVNTPPATMSAAHALMSVSARALAAYYENAPADVGNITRDLTWSGLETIVSTSLLVSFTGGGGSEDDFDLVVDHSTLTFTGQDIHFQLAAVESGITTLLFSGSEITLVYEDSTDYSLTVDHSTFTFTGEDITLTFTEGTQMPVDHATLMFTGMNIGLVYSGSLPTYTGAGGHKRRGPGGNRGWIKFSR